MAKEIEPVCGMEVDSSTDFKSEHMGKMFYFCSAEDKAEFEKHPLKYHVKEMVGSVGGRR
jgi:Cu+-exporting ATPase